MARIQEIVAVLVMAVAGCGDDAVAPGDESTGGSTDGPMPSTSVGSSSSPSTSASTTGMDTEGSSTTMEDETTTSSSSSSESSSAESSSSSESSDTSTSTGPDACGNESIDVGEDCDGDDLGGADCTSLGAGIGELACGADCLYDTSGCFFALCGNDMAQRGEECDGTDLAGNDCTTIGYPAGGDLSCMDNCTFDASGCFGPLCGDDVIDEPESCDGLNLAGNDCEVLGYDGGTLACTNTCILDESGCYIGEFLQNDNGNCGFVEVGCSLDGGMSGNPQDLLECYTSNLAPPIEVVEVEYFLGDVDPLPDTLDLVVHAWDGPGNAPGALLGTAALDPMIDIVSGGHILVLPTPIVSDTAGFCIGFHGEDPLDGFRVEFTDADATVGESWILAEACGVPDFSELSDLLTNGNFCIRPTVNGH
jgi:hypothetical protein